MVNLIRTPDECETVLATALTGVLGNDKFSLGALAMYHYLTSQAMPNPFANGHANGASMEPAKRARQRRVATE